MLERVPKWKKILNFDILADVIYTQGKDANETRSFLVENTQLFYSERLQD